MKRALLFVATNLAIVAVLSLSLSLLGVEPWLTQLDLHLPSLLIFAAVLGMGGSFISLALSKWMARRATSAVFITQPRNR